MPEISRFFGIIITMYYNDHAPPHFHVRYGKQKGRVSIQELRVLDGNLSLVPGASCLNGLASTRTNCGESGTMRQGGSRCFEFSRWSESHAKGCR